MKRLKIHQVLIVVLSFAVLLVITTALMTAGVGEWARRLARGGEAVEKIDLGPLAYTGAASCRECHEAEFNDWLGSHHDLAMKPATPETVIADFDTSHTYFGVTSRFFTRGDKFFVETDGPTGALREFEIAYTFGVAPLQQFLIAFPGGRLQALNVCWDARPAAEGGQRWFHLYPDMNVTSRDVFHWTGAFQNWNYMCAACHSTDLRKNYDPAADAYDTRWSEINVSCEACHGPGSRHLEWARLKDEGRNPAHDGAYGLTVSLKDKTEATWVMNQETGIAERTAPLASRAELETCAACHSRRSEIAADWQPGAAFLDHFRPALLDENLYFADGQIQDEVYEWASFQQSKMFMKGVRCSDCHNPHTMQPKYEGNALCLQCHLHTKYDTPDHHFHKMDDTGASCVGCHMPPRNYMVIDARNDHSFRVPRPDLSEKLETPNACIVCHADKSNEWAAKAFAKWYPDFPVNANLPIGQSVTVDFAPAFHAARIGDPRAGRDLAAIAADGTRPPIVRATALGLLGRYANAEIQETIQKGLADPDPLVRFGAAQSLESLELKQRYELGVGLLSDPVRAVRLEAARHLAPMPLQNLQAEETAKLSASIEEFIVSCAVEADHPGGRMRLGAFYASLNRFDDAEREYKGAIRLSPAFLPAYINLADLHRQQGRDADGRHVLDEALTRATVEAETAPVHHALGLLLVRQKDYDGALEHLRRAAELGPDDPANAYVYAVALTSLGRPADALLVLRAAHDRHPYHLDTLALLIQTCQSLGLNDEARRHAAAYGALQP